MKGNQKEGSPPRQKKNQRDTIKLRRKRRRRRRRGNIKFWGKVIKRCKVSMKYSKVG